MRPSHALLALLAAALLAFPATSMAGADSLRTTFLLSRAADGGLPNGPSRNAAVSHDQRIARVMAYESDASNIVGGDSNGLTDVFVVFRAGPWGSSGTPWQIGQTKIASTGLGGQPANGRSYRPALDGDSHNAPKCVAFISDASNLVPGDTNGKADAFVHYLYSGKTVRVSVDSRGKQANGSSYEVSVDGDCERVAFTSDATNLALRKGGNRAWQTAKTSQSRAGVKQVYVRVLNGKRHDKGFKGMTFLASASNSGRAGNNHSWGPYFARAGKAVVFSSLASNLTGGDGNGQADVYERTFTRQFTHLGHGKGVQALVFQTRLVSATSSGKSGNGASTNASVSDDGRYVAFQTTASNLVPGDSNGVSDVLEANMAGSRARQTWVSRSEFSGIGNGPSANPVISDAGEFVLFDSEATNLKPSASVNDDPNGVRDVFLWNRPTGNVSLESRNSENSYLSTPSQHPATSSRGNYVPFESANPAIDLAFQPALIASVSQLGGDAAASSAGVKASAIPSLIDPSEPAATPPAPGTVQALHQIYLRYLGPK
jgi:hypothetical protein